MTPRAESQIALLTSDGSRLLLDSEALQQAVYVYSPVFAPGSDQVVDLEIVKVNEAARHVLLSEHIVEGLRVSEVFVDLDAALEAATAAWRGEVAPTYRIERRGVHNGRPLTVRYEVSTLRAGDHIVQVSVDRTIVEALASADQRFRLMAEASVDGLMLLEPDPADPASHLLSYANPRALVSEPALRIGGPLPASFAELVRDAAAELVDVAPVRRYLQREVLARRVSLEATFTDVGDGQIMVTVRELTSRESARAELERSDRVLRAIGAGAFGTIAVYEPRFDGRVLVGLTLLWSAAGHADAAGHRPPIDPTTVFPAGELLDMARTMLHDDQPTRSGWLQVVDDGVERSVEFTLVLAGDRFVLEFVERTEELAARTQLAMIAAASEAQRSFLSRISHEMRSPLNVIHGYTQLLGRLHLADPAEAYVGHIERGVGRMVQIVDDLLLLGQLDQGLLRMDEQRIDVTELAAEVLRVAEHEPWWRAGVMVADHIADTAPAYVRTDRTRFVTAAVLLGEAAAGLPSTDGMVVAPFVRGARAGLQFTVPAASPVVEELWQPFVGSHLIPGAGLGMAVARSMAKALELLVEVREVPDAPHLTRLVLSLPVVT